MFIFVTPLLYLIIFDQLPILQHWQNFRRAQHACGLDIHLGHVHIERIEAHEHPLIEGHGARTVRRAERRIGSIRIDGIANRQVLGIGVDLTIDGESVPLLRTKVPVNRTPETEEMIRRPLMLPRPKEEGICRRGGSRRGGV